MRGIRIEDDVLVTEGEPEVLSAAIPKEMRDIEAVFVSDWNCPVSNTEHAKSACDFWGVAVTYCDAAQVEAKTSGKSLAILALWRPWRFDWAPRQGAISARLRS